jgi:Na+/proline symporter
MMMGVVVTVYLVAMLALGWYAQRRIKSTDDYYVAAGT